MAWLSVSTLTVINHPPTLRPPSPPPYMQHLWYSPKVSKNHHLQLAASFVHIMLGWLHSNIIEPHCLEYFKLVFLEIQNVTIQSSFLHILSHTYEHIRCFTLKNSEMVFFNMIFSLHSKCLIYVVRVYY